MLHAFLCCFGARVDCGFYDISYRTEARDPGADGTTNQVGATGPAQDDEKQCQPHPNPWAVPGHGVIPDTVTHRLLLFHTCMDTALLSSMRGFPVIRQRFGLRADPPTSPITPAWLPRNRQGRHPGADSAGTGRRVPPGDRV